MRHLTVILLLIISSRLSAGKTPDSLAVSKLYSTSWTLVEKFQPKGMFHRLRKAESGSEMNITIYQNEIHTELVTGKYQICGSRHKNQNEFWLDCKQFDQLIYRVIKIDGDELVIDVLRRESGKSSYKLASRNYYKRRRT